MIGWSYNRVCKMATPLVFSKVQFNEEITNANCYKYNKNEVKVSGPFLPN